MGLVEGDLNISPISSLVSGVGFAKSALALIVVLSSFPPVLVCMSSSVAYIVNNSTVSSYKVIVAPAGAGSNLKGWRFPPMPALLFHPSILPSPTGDLRLAA